MAQSERKALRLILDANIHVPAAKALRGRGFDVVGTWEAGRETAEDEAQLEWAAAQDGCLVTFNVGHFTLLHEKWLVEGREHTGIVVSAQIPLREFLRRCYILLNSYTPAMLRNQLLWLPRA